MDSTIVTDTLFPLEGPFATINGLELTRGAAQVAIEAIRSMSDNTLKAKRGELNLKGLEPRRVRERLVQAISTPAPLPSGLASILKKRIRAYSAFELFSDDLITRLAPLWPAIFGQHASGLALVLSDRPNLQAVGQRLLHISPDKVLTDLRNAGDILLHTIGAAFGGHLEELSGKFNTHAATWKLMKPTPGDSMDDLAPAGHVYHAAGEYAATLDAQQAKITALTDQLRSQQDAVLERLASENMDWSKKFDAAQERANRVSGLEAQLKACNEREREMLACIAKRERLFEDEVKQRVDTELSKAVRPWLAEAQELEKMSATRTDLELEESVRFLLKQQEALDLKYGSRARLKHRLSQFASYAEKVRAVLEDSLAPHPELEPLLRRLEVEMRHLRLQLNLLDNESPHFGKLVEAISRADSEESLAELERSIDDLAERGVFSNREATSFFRRLHVAYDKLALKNQESSIIPRLRSGWELRNTLARNRPATVYLDAHNVLLQMVDCYKGLFEGGRITPKAEEALIQDVLKLAENRQAVLFRVVIDASEAGEETRTPNVVVERTAGIGRDRADSAIILHASRSSHRNDWFVVTEDKSLRAQATGLGGVFAPVPVWQLMLEGFGVRQQLEEPVNPSAIPTPLA